MSVQSNQAIFCRYPTDAGNRGNTSAVAAIPAGS